MSMIFTLQEVSEHNTKADLYVTIHNKVYDCSSFVKTHPGGDKVLLEFAGSDATEAFEDVGHSDEARATLEGLYVGNIKQSTSESFPKGVTHSSPPAASKRLFSSRTGVYTALVICCGVFYAVNQRK